MCQQATSARSSLIRPLVGAGPQHHGCTILDILASFLQHSGDMFSIVSQLSWFRLLTVCWSLCNWKHMFHGTRRKMFPACCSQKIYRGKNATRSEVLPGVVQIQLFLPVFIWLFHIWIVHLLHCTSSYNKIMWKLFYFRSNPENEQGMQHLYKDLHKCDHLFVCVGFLLHTWDLKWNRPRC